MALNWDTRFASSIWLIEYIVVLMMIMCLSKCQAPDPLTQCTVSFPLLSLCLTEESLCSNSENLSPGEETPPPPATGYEFSQKTPDGLGSFC